MTRMVRYAVALGCVAGVLLVLGLGAGSTGWQAPWSATDAVTQTVLWELRLPRTLAAALVGALLALAGAIAQGLFRNPLADPYLLGSASGAGLCMALGLLAGVGAGANAWAGASLMLCAFVGALAGVALTLLLARGAEHTWRLLLAGVVVGVVLGALTQWLMLGSATVWRAMQTFMLGHTALLDWAAVRWLAPVTFVSVLLAWSLARVLDALVLGEDTARSLGVPLGGARVALVALLAACTAAAVAEAGLVSFVGLVAPHLVRPWVQGRHRWLLPMSALMGAVLLMAADVASRSLLAPQELPVGVLTAILGGSYLLVLLNRRRA